MSNLTFKIRDAAKQDLREAFRWYEQQRQGLGSDFTLCVEIALAKICRNPEIYPVVYQTVRRGYIRRPFDERVNHSTASKSFSPEISSKSLTLYVASGAPKAKAVAAIQASAV